MIRNDYSQRLEWHLQLQSNRADFTRITPSFVARFGASSPFLSLEQSGPLFGLLHLPDNWKSFCGLFLH